jgi:hypothetical protein
MTTQNILLGALVVQGALAALTWWPSADATVTATELVPGGANSITALEIVAGRDDAEPVSLVSNDGKWTLASSAGYPADADKVADVLEKLAEMKVRAPIATQTTSHEKMKVGDSGFGRKVTFTADGTEQTLYIGSAASKSIYVRKDGTPEVYEVKGASEWDFKDAARNYWTANYLELDDAALTTLSIDTPTVDLSFTRTDGAWQLDGGPEGLVADSTKVDELASKLKTVRLQEPVGKEVDPAFGLGRAAIAWTVTEGEQTVPGSLELGNDKDANVYAKLDTNPFVALVPNYALKGFLETTVEDLTEPAPEAAPEE